LLFMRRAWESDGYCRFPDGSGESIKKTACYVNIYIYIHLQAGKLLDDMNAPPPEEEPEASGGLA
jgi:hypothetical protein